MVKIKSEIWTKDNGERYVMMTLQDFKKLQDLVEDAGLSRIMRASMKRQASAPTISHQELKRQLGIVPWRRKKAG
jgi:hypothetical protein